MWFGSTMTFAVPPPERVGSGNSLGVTLRSTPADYLIVGIIITVRTIAIIPNLANEG